MGILTIYPRFDPASDWCWCDRSGASPWLDGDEGPGGVFV